MAVIELSPGACDCRAASRSDASPGRVAKGHERDRHRYERKPRPLRGFVVQERLERVSRDDDAHESSAIRNDCCSSSLGTLGADRTPSLVLEARDQDDGSRKISQQTESRPEHAYAALDDFLRHGKRADQRAGTDRRDAELQRSLEKLATNIVPRSSWRGRAKQRDYSRESGSRMALRT